MAEARGTKLRTLLAVAYDGRYIVALLIALGLYVEVRRAAMAAAQAQLRAVRIEAAIAKYMQAMLDQQTGLRGYLATGDERFLEPYYVADRVEPALLEALEGALGDDAERFAPQVVALRTSAERWQKEVADPQLALRRAAPLVELAGAMAAGKEVFATVRTAARQLETALAAATAREIEEREVSLARTRAAAGVVFVLLLFAGLLVSRFVESRTADPVTELALAADGDRPFVVQKRRLHVRELVRLSQALEALRQRVADREALLARQRAEAEEVRGFAEAVQLATGEDEVYGMLERALQRALEPARLQVVARNPLRNRLDVVLPPMPSVEQEKLPIVRDSEKCRAVSSSGIVALEAGSPNACICALGVPEGGAYLCVPMLAARQVIGLVNLQGPRGYATYERLRLAEAYVVPAAAALSTLRLQARLAHRDV